MAKKYKITEATNFLRVFCLPDKLPSDYCFGGGHPSIFTVIDWFNAIPPQSLWEKDEIVYEEDGREYQELRRELCDFIKGKKYYNTLKTFMILTDYGDIFLVNPELRTGELQRQYDDIRKDDND